MEENKNNRVILKNLTQNERSKIRYYSKNKNLKIYKNDDGLLYYNKTDLELLSFKKSGRKPSSAIIINSGSEEFAKLKLINISDLSAKAYNRIRNTSTYKFVTRYIDEKNNNYFDIAELESHGMLAKNDFYSRRKQVINIKMNELTMEQALAFVTKCYDE